MFLDARQFTAMHYDGERISFTNVRVSVAHGTALKMWKKHWSLFSRESALFEKHGNSHINILYIQRLKKRLYAARLSTLFVLLKSVSGKSGKISF